MTNLLIVDDEPGILDSLSKLLTKEGFGVKTAMTPAAGLESFLSAKPDLVLLDLNLRNENGLDVLQKMHAADPSVPVVILTGYGYDNETVTEAAKRGAANYVLKSSPLPILLFKIRTVLKRHSAPKAAAPKETDCVLVVDDDSSVCDAIKRFMEGAGFRVIVVSDAGKVLETAQKNKIDLIFLDLLMPGKVTGLDLLEELVRSHKHVPVIVISALQDEEVAKSALQKGAKEFITKPFSFEQLKVVALKSLGC